jgi:hypothetical protein
MTQKIIQQKKLKDFFKGIDMTKDEIIEAAKLAGFFPKLIYNAEERFTKFAEIITKPLEDEIRRLHTGDNLKALVDDDTNQLMQTCLEMNGTIASQAKQIEVLKTYVEHLDGCIERNIICRPTQCTCGLDEALALGEHK